MTGRLAVGVDLGGTNVRAALVEVATEGKILAERRVALEERSPEAVAALVHRLVTEVDPQGARHGVGVGFTGMLRGLTGVVVNAPALGWREVDFRSMLRGTLGPKVEVYNDMSAIAYGETAFGAARGARDVLCVHIGSGIGAGLVLEGELYLGAGALAGEMGHMKVVQRGRLCGCGARGCLEAYAAGDSLAARARDELGSHPSAASLAVKLAGGLDKLHAGHLDQAVRDGDVYATTLWEEVAPMLGQVLANAVTLMNPARVVMGGKVWHGAPELQRRTIDAFAGLVNAPSSEGLLVVSSTLGDNAGVVGAAALIASVLTNAS